MRAGRRDVVASVDRLAGVPLAVLRSFTAPPQGVRDDREAFADRLQGAVGALLGASLARMVLTREGLTEHTGKQPRWQPLVGPAGAGGGLSYRRPW